MFGKYKTRPHNNQILVIGLGQIGYSNAHYMRSLGLDVAGYDINEQAVLRALRDGVIKKRATDFRGFDYYVICISTHRPDDMSVPYLDGLFDIARRLSYEAKSGALVGIDSTIPKGTCHQIIKILGHRLHVVHVPHRYYVHEKEEHGVRQTRVAGGCFSCCLEEAARFYGNLLKIPIHIVSSIEIAELCKVVENAYRFMEIAFAEELKIVCDSLAIDFEELRNAANTKWNIKIFEARDGIGGHCLPKDSQMFLDLSKNVLATSLIRTAKMIDEKYRFRLDQQSTPEVLLPTR